jgi:ABC-2 type transport system permease protein
LIVFLLLPVTPLLVAFAVSTLFMRVTNAGRLRDTLRFIGGIFGIGIYVLIQVFLRSNFIASPGDGSKIEAALTGPTGILHNIGTYFPPGLWAAYAIILPPFQGGIKYWLYVILSTVFLIGVSIWFSEKIFLKSYIGSFEGSRKYRNAVENGASLTAAAHLGRSRSRSVVRSLYAKEFKTFFRSPTLTMNSIASMIITTFAVLLPSTAHSDHASFVNSLHANGMLMSLLGAAGVFFLGTLNSTAGTSISREGSNFFTLKSLPIRALDFVMMKWWFANLFVGVAGLIVTGVLIWLFHAGVLVILVSLVLGFLPCMAYNAFSLMIDLSFPKLDWTNEQAMMKGMKNFFLVFGEIILCGILAAIGALLHFLVHMPWIGITILYAFLFACILAIGISLMRSNAERLMRMIE